jgi:hypothetical protein
VLLNCLHDSERVKIVVEAFPETLHLTIELLFSRVSKRRMTDVMHQRECLCQILIQTQNAGDRACDLSDFNRMSQSVSEMVVQTRTENLSLIFQAPKGSRMDDAVAIALKIISVGMT